LLTTKKMNQWTNSHYLC